VNAPLARGQRYLRQRQHHIARINEKIVGIQQRMLEPDTLAGAVEALDPLWDSLSPTRRARLVHLLIDHIGYDGEDETISVTFHPTGIRSLTEQREEEFACPTN
jgi:site-specific DNA recombinase